MEVGELVAKEPHALVAVADVGELAGLDPSFNRRGVHVLFGGTRHLAEENRGLRHRIKAVVFEIVRLAILKARKQPRPDSGVGGQLRADHFHQFIVAQFRAPKITRVARA
jgi:hypothetical protein